MYTLLINAGLFENGSINQPETFEACLPKVVLISNEGAPKSTEQERVYSLGPPSMGGYRGMDNALGSLGLFDRNRN